MRGTKTENKVLTEATVRTDSQMKDRDLLREKEDLTTGEREGMETEKEASPEMQKTEAERDTLETEEMTQEIEVS